MRTANGLILKGETFNGGIRKNGFRGDLSLVHSLYQGHALDAANLSLAAICARGEDEDLQSEHQDDCPKAPSLHYPSASSGIYQGGDGGAVVEGGNDATPAACLAVQP